MKKFITLWMMLIFVFTFTACSGSTVAAVTDAQSSVAAAAETAATGAETNAASTVSATGTVAELLAENSQVHEADGDYEWDSAAVVPITLNGDSIGAGAEGVTVEGSTATITAAGTYSLSGSLADGQIVVDTKDEEVVRLILNGVEITSTTSAPIYIQNAEKAVIVLAEGTENTITDGTEYVFESADEDEPNAAIFSKADLSIYGSGSLVVNGNYNDAIASKDGLVIASGTITANAVDDGIRGKDYLVIRNGNITVNAQGDGLKSDNEEDAEKGYISIETGVINITAGGDAIQAQTDVLIASGEFMLISGGGSEAQISEDTSAKGIKASANVSIDGGTFNLNTADDAVNSNGSLTVSGGSWTITAGDDGMHADAALVINGGDIHITQSYEGIESAVITINAGNISVVASDDGINVAGGTDGSGMNTGMGPGRAPMQGGGPGQDVFSGSVDYYLYIHGGYIVVDAGGDGLDANGAIEMTGGTVLVNGPTNSGNGALDYDASFNISGGVFVAAGSAGMAQMPSESSGQASVMITLDTTQAAGTLVHIQNSAGEDVLTFAPAKEFQTIVVSAPELVQGEGYEVYTGGSSSGTVKDGLYEGGSYTAGTLAASVTLSDVATRVGNGGGMQRP